MRVAVERRYLASSPAAVTRASDQASGPKRWPLQTAGGEPSGPIGAIEAILPPPNEQIGCANCRESGVRHGASDRNAAGFAVVDRRRRRALRDHAVAGDDAD